MNHLLSAYHGAKSLVNMMAIRQKLNQVVSLRQKFPIMQKLHIRTFELYVHVWQPYNKDSSMIFIQKTLHSHQS